MRKRTAILLLAIVPVLVVACKPAPHPDRLACIRSHESANLPNPWAAYNPAGPYMGAYQYLQSTWNSVAAEQGRHDLVGRPPMEPYVSRYDQDFVTGTYIETHGNTKPWGNTC